MADENTLLNSDLESRYEKYKGIIKNFTLMSDIFTVSYTHLILCKLSAIPYFLYVPANVHIRSEFLHDIPYFHQ